MPAEVQMLRRTKGKTMLLRTVIVGVAVLVSQAALAADAAKGKIVAQRWCASCHVVAKDQSKGSVDAPTFAAISAGRTVAQIKGALVTAHTQMPDMSLTREEVENLIVYLQTQAKPLDPYKQDPQKDNPPKKHRG